MPPGRHVQVLELVLVHSASATEAEGIEQRCFVIPLAAFSTLPRSLPPSLPALSRSGRLLIMTVTFCSRLTQSALRVFSTSGSPLVKSMALS